MTDIGYSIDIFLSQQKLSLCKGDKLIAEYSVSTARNGAGEKQNSECTPRGKHRIVEKFGDECPVDSVLVGRKPTGEIYTPELRECYPARDWILTRILRLEGIEEGFNRGGDVDTYERFIYIHGSPDDVPMGVPGSHGCIRMRNQDVLSLYGTVPVGTRVDIHE
jgi:L,D-transpeptidase YbiS